MNDEYRRGYQDGRVLYPEAHSRAERAEAELRALKEAVKWTQNFDATDLYALCTDTLAKIPVAEDRVHEIVISADIRCAQTLLKVLETKDEGMSISIPDSSWSDARIEAAIITEVD